MDGRYYHSSTSVQVKWISSAVTRRSLFRRTRGLTDCPPPAICVLGITVWFRGCLTTLWMQCFVCEVCIAWPVSLQTGRCSLVTVICFFICRWTTAQHLLCFCGHYQVSAPAPSFLESQNHACKDYNVYVIGRIIIEGAFVKKSFAKNKHIWLLEKRRELWIRAVCMCVRACTCVRTRDKERGWVCVEGGCGAVPSCAHSIQFDLKSASNIQIKYI